MGETKTRLLNSMFRNFSGEKSLLMPYLSKAARMAVRVDEPER
jgi:hypothetical protein